MTVVIPKFLACIYFVSGTSPKSAIEGLSHTGPYLVRLPRFNIRGAALAAVPKIDKLDVWLRLTFDL